MNEPSTTQWFTPKQRDFLIGLIGWYLVNGIVWTVIVALPGGDDFFLGMLTFPLNLLVLLIAAIKWKPVALGILAAMAINMVASLILQVGMLGTCAIPFFVEFLAPGQWIFHF